MRLFRRSNRLMRPETVATLEIFIQQIQEALPQGEVAVRAVIKGWVDANGLKPDDVETVTLE